MTVLHARREGTLIGGKLMGYGVCHANPLANHAEGIVGDAARTEQNQTVILIGGGVLLLVLLTTVVTVVIVRKKKAKRLLEV